ncbi:MAG TPA: AsmA-like C-terminal region-containing protein [Planctomycetota bacterium]|nr:AsmA-like C-terminal region-containing protein [Planctomycetota bacterium]
MRPSHALLHRLALILACLVLGLATLALALERSGWLRRIVRGQLVARLGEPLAIGEVRLSWFDAAIEIDDLDLGLEQDAVELERVRIVLRASRGLLPRPALIEVVGGRLLLGSELEARAAAMQLEGDAPRGRVPALVLRDVRLALRHPRLGMLPIGRVHAAFESDERGHRKLTGHLQPGLASAVADARRAPASLVLSGAEREPGEFVLQLSADGAPFDVDDLPEGSAFDDLRASGLRGRLSVAAELQLSLTRLTQASGHVRARLAGASLVPSPDSAPLNNLTVDLDARCQPAAGGSVADWDAWRVLAQLGGSWRGAQIDAWGVLGSHAGPGRGARTWVHVRDLPLDDETVAALRLSGAGMPTWRSLAPGGTADVVVGGEFDRDGHPRLTLEVSGDGDLEVAFVGYPPRRGGPPEGFPMPLSRVHGRMVALFDPQASPRMRLGILGARGSHTLDAPEQRLAWLRGQVRSELSPEVLPDWDVRFGARRIPIDGGGIPLGLSGLSGTDWIWPAFRPAGGEAAFDAAMQHVGQSPGMSAVFRIRAEGTSVAWQELPLPVQDASLDLELRFAPRHAWGVGFRGQGRGATSDRVRVAGRLWSGPRADDATSSTPPFEEVSIEVENVSLRGTDRQLLGSRVPEIETLLEQVAAAGKVDVGVRTSGAGADGRVLLSAEITPREVSLAPQAFRVQTRDVRGRVLVTSQSLRGPADGAPVSARVRLVPLVGEWPGGARVACTADVRGGRGELAFLAAGLEPLNRGLVGALQASVGGAGAAGGLDLSALSVDGRVDAHGEVLLAAADPARDANRFRVFLRDNDFRIAPPSGTPEGGGFGLTRLNGVLLQEEGELSGSGIRAQLGRTPLVLREARFALDEEGFRLETRPSARGLPLDREHLRYFLDPGAVDALIDELGFGGALDIDDARLVLAGRAGRAGRVSFEGRVTPRDLHVDLGLPVAVASAAMQIESLVFEAGHVRAWATVEALEGQIAGRQLRAGRLQLTYVEPHLSILDLEATLEGGRLAHLGGTGTSGAPAFSMDLAAPFPFDLGLSMSDVDVEGLLRGVFESEFASSGLASGELRLTGDLERVRSIRGDGWLSLRDSTLWSIPVMRALFSQLGFDNTAVFERIRTRFGVRDGALDMDAIGVYSPLLQLVGSGSLDFEGRLHHDLEVRYSLVDNLGPFRRALYWIQNNLLSIAVRGDMSRPRVEISGLLSFLTTAGGGRRDLPLPPLTALPERF